MLRRLLGRLSRILLRRTTTFNSIYVHAKFFMTVLHCLMATVYGNKSAQSNLESFAFFRASLALKTSQKNPKKSKKQGTFRSREALNPHTSVFTKVWVGRLTESTGQLALRIRRGVRRCVRGNVEERTQWGMSARCQLNISPIKRFDCTLRFVRGNTWLLKPLRDVYES